ncbi:ADP-ribosyl-[dinitrogen reductase] hydrolase [Aromatoleum toluolicum]|uniref:ADP-ribosyl-[dinitrogen reductase] hydrolase n=1 Tax=Aromatoleum toluolicum TaxID=90060 RepID=A0ABX1NE22_9RHOO|nr:ADP-ribosyl-[dinitrogen reductase] hydrolase [Aromatoleum toluolicum]NMF97465.1 ADP-ribosyl-[dinitrogen reductase] hydrolase [Aromatoleum toluolicum]
MTNESGPTLHERALGAYLGLAVGDALGATVEFLTPSEIRHQYGELRDIVGGGWLRLKAGQVTDDTQMSLALGAAILESGGWNLTNIATHWLVWLKSKPIDVGNTCRRGLVRYGRDGSLESPFSDGDAGNGALMRNLPAVLYAFRDAALLEHCSVAQAHVTHNHPLSDAATLCVARMLADLLYGGDWRDNLAKLRAKAKALVEAHRPFRFDPYPKRATGYVVDTVQTVLHAFFATDSFESCLIRTVNCGGDADTTGAIAGMLAGAHYGVDAIPGRWIKRLDRDVRDAIVRQVDGLLALGSA